MKPNYYAPATLEEAFDCLKAGRGPAAVIAGGTDLIPELRLRNREIARVVDLRHLHLDTIRVENGALILGAVLTHAQVSDSEEIRRCLPMLAAACSEVGGLPVRNRGTLGGNLATASPAADAAPPLLAYDAEVELSGAGGVRRLALCDFFLGPRRTELWVDEILTRIIVPLPPQWSAGRFIKLGKRSAMAIAVISVAVRLDLDDGGRIAAARIAIGSAAPTPRRITTAEDCLISRLPGTAVFEEAAATAAQHAEPISDVRASAEYRRRMVDVLTRRALAGVWKELVGDCQ